MIFGSGSEAILFVHDRKKIGIKKELTTEPCEQETSEHRIDV